MKHPYHRGNLRRVLLDTAIELIRHSGPAALTLREVARRAGVSHNAPYRHFRGKDELMAAVATEGFGELAAAMRQAAAREATALGRYRASGLGYLQFALRQQEHYTMMFDVPVGKERFPECEKAGEAAFQTLVGFIEGCQVEGTLPAGNPLPVALGAWSLVHGIAKLATAGRLPFRKKSDVLAFAESAFAGLCAAPCAEVNPPHERQR